MAFSRERFACASPINAPDSSLEIAVNASCVDMPSSWTLDRREISASISPISPALGFNLVKAVENSVSDDSSLSLSAIAFVNAAIRNFISWKEFKDVV